MQKQGANIGGDFSSVRRPLPSGDHGRNTGRGDQNFQTRWTNRRIPPPPKTPCSNPFDMPFTKLRARNANGTMTLDEELLRAIIGQFTVRAITNLPFPEIFERLKRENPHLSYLLYDDPAYLWAYLRCYPEQFAIDRDPRLPYHIWYTAKCKVVAKSDRRRYEREHAAGNLRVDSSIATDEEFDRLKYDPYLEHETMTYVAALFKQIGSKVIALGHGHVTHIPTSYIQNALEKASLPESVRGYMGDSVEEFMFRRLHFFNVFGNQISLRPNDYVNVIRLLSQKLCESRDTLSLRAFFTFLLTSPYLGQSGIRAISVDHDNFQYDDFLLFLHNNKFVFRLRTRENLVDLRFGVVPEISDSEIELVPEYECVKEISSMADLEAYEKYSADSRGFSRWASDGESAVDNETFNPETVGYHYLSTSVYIERWLEQNFGGRSSGLSGSDLTERPNQTILVPDGGNAAGQDGCDVPGGSNMTAPSQQTTAVAAAAQNTADWNAPKAKDGWPAWPLLSQRKPLASQSISATSDARLKPPEGQEKSELAWTKLGVEWNGCY